MYLYVFEQTVYQIIKKEGLVRLPDEAVILKTKCYQTLISRHIYQNCLFKKSLLKMKRQNAEATVDN